MTSFIRALSLLLILVVSGCTGFSQTSQNITGLWTKLDDEGQLIGFYLAPNGDLQLYNLYSWQGHRWAQKEHSLLWITSTGNSNETEISEFSYAVNKDTLDITNDSFFKGDYQRTPYQKVCGVIAIAKWQPTLHLVTNLVTKKSAKHEETLIAHQTIDDPADIVPFNFAVATPLPSKPLQLRATLFAGNTLVASQAIDYPIDSNKCMPTLTL